MTMTILFQGDSITDCGRTTCGGAGYNSKGLGPGYPCLIASRLACDFPQMDLQFINLGISGHRIVDLYARWKADCINLKPDVVSILIGINDTWHEVSRQNGVEVPRYARFYEEMITWTKACLPNVTFVLMDPFVCPGLPDRAPFVDDVAARDKVVADLAKKYGCIHVPLQEVFNDAFKRAPQEYWAADGVHPTPAGHQLITDAWLKATAHLFK